MPRDYLGMDELMVRDFFAALVAGPIFADLDADAPEAPDTETATKHTARVAYMLADALLKERSK